MPATLQGPRYVRATICKEPSKSNQSVMEEICWIRDQMQSLYMRAKALDEQDS